MVKFVVVVFICRKKEEKEKIMGGPAYVFNPVCLFIMLSLNAFDVALCVRAYVRARARVCVCVCVCVCV